MDVNLLENEGKEKQNKSVSILCGPRARLLTFSFLEETTTFSIDLVKGWGEYHFARKVNAISFVFSFGH